MSEYARVYLLDNPYFLDRAFEYFIPSELREKIHEGDFVTVPFGNSNQKCLGLVSELCGIPEKAEERLAIAQKILAEAQKYGIEKKDIIFDPLAMTVSADKNAASETLRAVELINTRLGCHTSLGVSNVSFGLPERDVVNSAFFTLSLRLRLARDFLRLL